MNAEQQRYKIGGYSLSIINFPSKNVYVGAFINNGSIDETHATAGINHLLEHILINSWSKCDKKSCFTYWDKRPVSTNGSTTPTYVKYFINGLRSELANMIDYIFEIITNPHIDKTLSTEEKKIVMNELYNNMNDPLNQLILKMKKVLYTDKGIINFYDDKLQKDNLTKITYKELVHYYKTFYIPNKITFYICGKFNDAQTTKILDTCRVIISNRCPLALAHTSIIKQYYDVFSNKSQVIYHKNQNAKNTDFIIDIPFSKTELTYKDKKQIEIVVQLLQRNLFDLLRTQKKLVYGINVDSDIEYCDGVLCISGSCIDVDIKNVLTEIFEFISNLQQQYIKLYGLENEKARQRMFLNDTKLTPAKLCDFYQSQNYFNHYRHTKRTYTYQEMLNVIDNVKYTNVLKILKDAILKHAVVGYISQKNANIKLASIIPK